MFRCGGVWLIVVLTYCSGDESFRRCSVGGGVLFHGCCDVLLWWCIAEVMSCWLLWWGIVVVMHCFGDALFWWSHCCGDVLLHCCGGVLLVWCTVKVLLLFWGTVVVIYGCGDVWLLLCIVVVCCGDALLWWCIVGGDVWLLLCIVVVFCGDALLWWCIVGGDWFFLWVKIRSTELRLINFLWLRWYEVSTHQTPSAGPGGSASVAVSVSWPSKPADQLARSQLQSKKPEETPQTKPLCRIGSVHDLAIFRSQTLPIYWDDNANGTVKIFAHGSCVKQSGNGNRRPEPAKAWKPSECKCPWLPFPHSIKRNNWFLALSLASFARIPSPAAKLKRPGASSPRTKRRSFCDDILIFAESWWPQASPRPASTVFSSWGSKPCLTTAPSPRIFKVQVPPKLLSCQISTDLLMNITNIHVSHHFSLQLNHPAYVVAGHCSTWPCLVGSWSKAVPMFELQRRRWSRAYQAGREQQETLDASIIFRYCILHMGGNNCPLLRFMIVGRLIFANQGDARYGRRPRIRRTGGTSDRGMGHGDNRGGWGVGQGGTRGNGTHLTQAFHLWTHSFCDTFRVRSGPKAPH